MTILLDPCPAGLFCANKTLTGETYDLLTTCTIAGYEDFSRQDGEFIYLGIICCINMENGGKNVKENRLINAKYVQR